MVRRRGNVFKYPLVGNVAAARVGERIEGSQHGFSVDQNPEDPAGLAASRAVVLAEYCLGKVQMQLINAGLQRDVITEIAFASGAEQLRIGRRRDGMVGRSEDGSAAEEPVAGPDIAGPVHMPNCR